MSNYMYTHSQTDTALSNKTQIFPTRTHILTHRYRRHTRNGHSPFYEHKQADTNTHCPIQSYRRTFHQNTHTHPCLHTHVHIRKTNSTHFRLLPTPPLWSIKFTRLFGKQLPTHKHTYICSHKEV